ncbi:MAG: DUF1294 domain-containing protein [Clostridia bacterium]|nr:DUF1294 domain-containing protein [Clostridia bacterium]
MWYLYLTVYFLIASAVTFCFYAADKGRAKRNARRVPEKTLLLMSFFGGALGGTLAMYVCRHKTKHWYFVVVNLFSLLLHAAAVIMLRIYL